jgi:ornithine cyclodeaminase
MRVKIRFLSAHDVRKALPMSQAIEAMKSAYQQLSADQATVPLRSRLEVDNPPGVTLVMPAVLHGSGEMGVKIVSVFAQNPDRNLPTIHALVLALDPETGQPTAVLEGASLTALRTGAGSGAATDLLANQDTKVAAIFGSGAQARTQLEAICTVRPFEKVLVYSLDSEGAQRFISELAGQGPIPEDIAIAPDPKSAVHEADVICTATTSETPVFDGQDLKPGAHINAIGSFTPQMQEVDAGTVKKAALFVDSTEAVLAESGDLIQPIQQGILSPDHIQAELGEVAAGNHPGRTQAGQITLFKSVGVAVQDAISAGWAVREAERLNLGQVIDLN